MDGLIAGPGTREPGPWPASATTLAVPAHPDFVASVRALVRSTAVLADLAFEDVEELQIAVNEAAALLLPIASAADPTLTARLDVAPGRLQVRLAVTADAGTGVDRDSLAWLMLSTLAPGLDVDEEDGVHAIELARSRPEASSA